MSAEPPAETRISLPPPPTEKNEATEAGNYFVANYPPFSFWTREAVQEALTVLERPAPADLPMGLYFHVPFCRKRCHFCYFRVYTDKNAAEIKEYLDAGVREMEMMASKPWVQGRKPQFVYFGGGTPSYLSVQQLTDLTNRMKDLFPWDAAQEIAFEAEPGTLTEKKLDGIRQIGVTRLSLGVEHFDDHILEINGRAHRSGEIERAYAHARSIGFPQINIDLIAGMVEETEEKWKRAVARALELEPDSLTVYQMEVPYNTGIYQQMKAAGQLVAPVADWPTKRRWVDYAFQQFEAAGYTVTSVTTVVKDPAKTRFVYRDALWQGADLVPLGVASFGHLGGVHIQNHADIGPYMLLVQNGQLPVYRAYVPNQEERFIREFILTLKTGRVSARYFLNKFGIDPWERFAPQLHRLADENFGQMEGDIFSLNRDSLLQVDRLLHDFFLPQHRGARYT
ncbi:MAG: coproporphyrinogen III oxidase family protein [Verrucomicrobiales bacterium]|nr:coproporphyrinogen III oxidase family protein [Verrucomicrobiales bacterium]